MISDAFDVEENNEIESKKRNKEVLTGENKDNLTQPVLPRMVG